MIFVLLSIREIRERGGSDGTHELYKIATNSLQFIRDKLENVNTTTITIDRLYRSQRLKFIETRTFTLQE